MLWLILLWLGALMLYYRHVGNPTVLHDGVYGLAILAAGAFAYTALGWLGR
jgi:hypothetical protein